jgi:hypothetical protein
MSTSAMPHMQTATRVQRAHLGDRGRRIPDEGTRARAGRVELAPPEAARAGACPDLDGSESLAQAVDELGRRFAARNALRRGQQLRVSAGAAPTSSARIAERTPAKSATACATGRVAPMKSS